MKKGDALVEPTQVHVRHEVWGGRRYLNLQVECPSGSIGKGGTVATWTLIPEG